LCEGGRGNTHGLDAQCSSDGPDCGEQAGGDGKRRVREGFDAHKHVGLLFRCSFFICFLRRRARCRWWHDWWGYGRSRSDGRRSGGRCSPPWRRRRAGRRRWAGTNHRGQTLDSQRCCAYGRRSTPRGCLCSEYWPGRRRPAARRGRSRQRRQARARAGRALLRAAEHDERHRERDTGHHDLRRVKRGWARRRSAHQRHRHPRRHPPKLGRAF
jgi:hypothetical protein